MEKEKGSSERLLIATLFVGVAAGVIAGMAIYAIAYPIFQSIEWAAWVQALGSIGAIAGSLWVGRRQARSGLDSVIKSQRLAEKSRKKAVFALGEAAVERIKPIKQAFKEADPRSELYRVYHPSVANGIAGAISAAPIHELGSREAILALLDIRDQLIFLDQSIDSYLSPRDFLGTEARSKLAPERIREHDQSVDRIGIKNANDRLLQIEEKFKTLKAAVLDES